MLILSLIGCCKKTTGTEKSFLPDAPPGWKISQDNHYSPENLYDYINGGAELFLSYGFKDLRSRIYVSPDQPDIVLDLFDMGKPKDAYGVFTHSREEMDTTWGQGSQHSDGLLLFWKDRYYVSILSSPETPKSRETMFELARLIDGAIVAKGEEPDVLKLLPAGNLIEPSIRYFHHPAWLNTYHFIADFNLFNLSNITDALLAKYDTGDEQATLLLIRYPDEDSCRQTAESLPSHLEPGLDREQPICTEDQTWSVLVVKGPVVLYLFNGTGKSILTQITGEFEKIMEGAH